MTAFRSGLAGKSCICSFFGPFQTGRNKQVTLLRRVPLLKYRITRHAAVVQSTLDVDFPPYSILNKGAAYDLRLYDVYKIVRMPYERRDEGYIGLGAYFDGENSAKLRLRQSQPVVMRVLAEGRKTMELFVGSDLDGNAVAAAPQPLDSRLSLEVAGGEIAAVLRFEGSATRAATERSVARLREALQQDGLREGEDAGGFRLAQYGPFNSLSTRLNEVMLRIEM